MAFEEYKGAMFSTRWKTSERKYGYTAEKQVTIPMSDGVKLRCNIWKPDAGGKFPAILGFHCYHAEGQTGPIKPAAISTAQWRHPGQERTNASLEAGDPVFFARRGYSHVVCNARGTGNSELNRTAVRGNGISPGRRRSRTSTTPWSGSQRSRGVTATS